MAPAAEPPWLAWLDAARAGETAAYGRLVEHFWAGLVRLARGLAPAADAEDIVQDALVHAWDRLANLREAAALPGWLRTAVVRRCLRHRRRAILLRPLDFVLGLATGTAAGPELQIDAVRLLARLPARQRAALVLTEIEGLSDSEAAHEMGMAESTLRVHRHRARKRLRQWLEEESR